MQRITDKNKGLSFLQQRINYAQESIDDPIYFVENVPQRENDFSSFKLDGSKALNYGPSQGISTLINAICKREHQRYQLNLNTDQVMVSNGGMHALSLIFKLMHNSGNKILCQGPIFSGVAELLKSYNYQIAYIPADLNIHELQNFLQMYRNADLIYLNIPNNPTGKIYSSIYLELLLSFSKIHRKTLVLDLVYDEYVFSQFRNFNLLTITKDWDNIFTINSMSKNYGLPGLRVGWIVSHAKNILRLTKLLEDECVCVNPLAQEMAVVAMEEGNQYLIDKVHKGKITVEDTLSHHQQIHIDKLDGGTQYYAKFPVDDIDSFADYMLVQHKMILATSSNYETSDPTSIRIPIGCSGEKIKSCLNILIHGLNIYKNEFHIQT